MSYAVKELYLTVQGEGAQAGRAAVFVRFAGCNLWTGREEDRGNGPGSCSAWCDTDFVGGTRYDADALVHAAVQACSPCERSPLVVFTGGEPMLQLDDDLLDAFRNHGFEDVAIETNGTKKVEFERHAPWVTVSPKGGAPIVQRGGNELKLVFPQRDLMPYADEINDIAWNFEHRFVQPMDGPHRDENTKWAIEFVKKYPWWRLSCQLHKYVGAP